MNHRRLAISRLSLCFGLGFALAVSHAFAGNPEAHFNPANPRPDFSRKPLYNAWVPYRKAYNRPSYVGGHIAAVIEPTSQEAMAWQIAKARGDYKYHRPGYIPTYYYPKPWEALPIQPRPDRALAIDASPTLD